jgi:hypothetical protein
MSTHSTPTLKPIPGLSGYAAGDDGSIWSRWELEPIRGGRGTCAVIGSEWRRLKGSSLPSGRRYIKVCAQGKKRNRYVAHLILEAFVGPRPEGLEACHNDGDLGNNRPDNLRWDTHAANIADKLKHGTDNRGVKHNMVKLTEEQVRIARTRVRAGESRRKVAGELNVSACTIGELVARKTWRHLND